MDHRDPGIPISITSGHHVSVWRPGGPGLFGDTGFQFQFALRSTTAVWRIPDIGFRNIYRKPVILKTMVSNGVWERN